jgi:hypothetical protein
VRRAVVSLAPSRSASESAWVLVLESVSELASAWELASESESALAM